MQSGEQKKSKFRIRFSLRSLLLLTLLTSILLSSVGYRIVLYRREATVAARLEEWGARIDWTLTSRSRWASGALRRLKLGYLYLRVRGIELDAAKITPETIDDLAKLSELRQLRITRCSFQAEVASLNRLQQLEEFELSNNQQIGDEDLLELCLPQVQAWRLDQHAEEYTTLERVAAANPNLDLKALIRNKSTFELKRLGFAASPQYQSRWKWQFGEQLLLGNRFSREAWRSAKPHLDRYPGPIKTSFSISEARYVNPDRDDKPMYVSSISLKVRLIDLTDQQVIHAIRDPVNERPDAFTLIPPEGQVVAQLSAAHDIRVWIQSESTVPPDGFQLLIGKQVPIPETTDTILVSSNSLPVHVTTAKE